MALRFSVLGSGSRGNSVYIESGQTAILIDNGQPVEFDQPLLVIA